MKRFKINNSGFTLMEVIIAMALVTIVATFAATALAAGGKSFAKTQDISLSSDDSLSECEQYLAKDAEHGKTEGDYQLKKTSGGLAGFPDVKLEIKDSMDTSVGMGEADVKYVAFKRVPKEDDSLAATGGGGVSDSGAGLTSGDDIDSGDSGESGSGGSEGEHTEDSGSGSDSDTGSIVWKPVTEPVTEAVTEAVTEPQTEATTKSQLFNGGVSGANLADYIGKNNNTALQGEIKSADGISLNIGWSNINGVTSEGFIKLGSGQSINLLSPVGMKDGKKYKTILIFESSDGSIPKISDNGQQKSVKEYAIVDDGSGWRPIKNESGCEIYLAGIRFEEIVETTTTTTVTTTTTTTTTTTEATTETTTQAVSGQNTPSSAAGVGLSSSDLRYYSACSWSSGYIVSESLRSADGTTFVFNWSHVSDVTSEGIVISGGKQLAVGDVHDDSWNRNYKVTVTLATRDGSVPQCTIGGVQVSGNSYTLPEGQTQFTIASGNSEVIITGIHAERI